MTVRRVMPDLHAEDVRASTESYVGVLGPRAQISVMREDASASVRPDVSIEVDDVDAVHAAAQRGGHEVVHPLTDEPWGVRRFFVRDPTGKMVNVLSHR